MRCFTFLFSWVLLALPVLAEPVTLTPEGDHLRVDVGGQLFTRYMTTGSQRPHLYPVIGPSGAGLTRDYPAPDAGDHPHHSSIWIGHGKVSGVDFWLDGEDNGRIVHTGFKDVVSGENSASFTTTAQWVNPDGDVVLTDERRHTITAGPDGERSLDIAVTFKAGEDEVVFEDTKEGMMAIRVAPILSIREGKGKIVTSAGKTNKKAWGTKAEWVSYYGADPKGTEVVITMMDHPQNLRHPTPWHARDYGLLGANPFGLHDFERVKDNPTLGNHTIPAGGVLTQRYRILLQKGQPDQAALRRSFTQFSTAP